jgi:N-acetylglutamate synthase-like GNAT family acetyltransferase
MAAMLESLSILFAASEGYRSYVAMHEATGDLAAGAAIYVSPEKKLACIAGAATKNAYRGHGLQQALLRRRLIDATSACCDLAFMSTLLDTTSCRNAQRQGFVRGYERVVMRKANS